MPPGTSIGPGQDRALAAAARCFLEPRRSHFPGIDQRCPAVRNTTGAVRRTGAPVLPVFPTPSRSEKPVDTASYGRGAGRKVTRTTLTHAPARERLRHCGAVALMAVRGTRRHPKNVAGGLDLGFSLKRSTAPTALTRRLPGRRPHRSVGDRLLLRVRPPTADRAVTPKDSRRLRHQFNLES